MKYFALLYFKKTGKEIKAAKAIKIQLKPHGNGKLELYPEKQQVKMFF